MNFVENNDSVNSNCKQFEFRLQTSDFRCQASDKHWQNSVLEKIKSLVFLSFDVKIFPTVHKVVDKIDKIKAGLRQEARRKEKE